MASLLSCSNCKEKFDKEVLIYINKSKKLCPKCKLESETNAKQYRELIDFMCKGFNLKAPTGQQLKTIKKFKEQGMSYLDIHKLLYYVAVIKQYKFKDSKIDIITFYIDECITYYKQLQKSEESVSDISINIKPIFVKCELNYGVRKDKTRLIEIESIV